jgi:hypothetical protein
LTLLSRARIPGTYSEPLQGLGKPRIVAHHMIRREILLQLLSHSGDEGNEHNWAIPSAMSAEQHKEITVLQILHSQGLFPSDEALESKILEFFAQRTASALSYASHFTDHTDPSFLLRWNLIVTQIFSPDCASPPTR